MITLTTAILLCVGLVAVTWIGVRDHRALRASRRGLLNACASTLDNAQLDHGRDDFPRLDGKRGGLRVHTALVPDTLTIRRLPQLWLSMTVFESRPALSEYAVLVRPAGTEFYSLTSHYTERLETPFGLPSEVLIRGSGPDAQALLNRTTAMLVRIFADPKVKEIAVTRKGLRLVWQADEGRRGEHLLLRQSVFDGAGVTPTDFNYLIDRLRGLGRAIDHGVEAIAS